MYVGSAVDLSKRLKDYYSSNYLKRTNYYICNAIIHHTHSAFSLAILEYIRISNKSIDEAKALILEREQHYIDSLMPEYNILKTAGSSLGYKHTKETLAKMSEANLNKSLSEETKAKLSEINKGENHPFYGKAHTPETLVKISAAKGGGIIYLYSSDKSSLVNSFPSARKAAEYFNSNHHTIKRYVLNGQLFQGKWILSTSLITPIGDCES